MTLISFIPNSLPKMDLLVLLTVRGSDKPLLTERALVGFLSCVYPFMTNNIRVTMKSSRTETALKTAKSLVIVLMCTVFYHICELFPTDITNLTIGCMHNMRFPDGIYNPSALGVLF